MKTVFWLICLVVQSAFGVEPNVLSGCDSTDLILANRIADTARVKGLSTYERWLAEDAALDVSFCSRFLSKDDYCVIKERNIQRLRDSILDWYRTGLLSTESTTHFMGRLLTYRAQCSSH